MIICILKGRSGDGMLYDDMCTSFLSPLLCQVAVTVEEQVTASAPGVAMKLSEAAVLVDQAGKQTAQQVQVGGHD
jgi:hypothetical protein